MTPVKPQMPPGVTDRPAVVDLAIAMAQNGYGWEDIYARVAVTKATARLIVLGRKL
jgi:hypothetical protein